MKIVKEEKKYTVEVYEAIEGTLSDRISNITKACGYDIKYELNKLDNETN